MSGRNVVVLKSDHEEVCLIKVPPVPSNRKVAFQSPDRATWDASHWTRYAVPTPNDLDGSPSTLLSRHCAKIGKRFSFVEVSPEVPSWNYAYVVKVDDVAFPRGTGKTKKRAKANAAEKALSMMMMTGDWRENRIDVDAKQSEIAKGSVIDEGSEEWLEDESESNAWERLKSLCEERDWPTDFEWVKCTGGMITCKIDVNGACLGYAEGKVRRFVLERAAIEALENFDVASASDGPTPQDKKSDIQALVERKAREILLDWKKPEGDLLVQSYKAFRNVPIVAFVVRRNSTPNSADVVAMAVNLNDRVPTSGFFNFDALYSIARNAFRSFLLEETQRYFEGRFSIFCSRSGFDDLLFRDDVSVLVYSSHPFEMEDLVANSLKGPRMLKRFFNWRNTRLSASDRLMPLNRYGLEGAMIANIMFPVDVSSVVFGLGASSEVVSRHGSSNEDATKRNHLTLAWIKGGSTCAYDDETSITRFSEHDLIAQFQALLYEHDYEKYKNLRVKKKSFSRSRITGKTVYVTKTGAVQG